MIQYHLIDVFIMVKEEWLKPLLIGETAELPNYTLTLSWLLPQRTRFLVWGSRRYNFEYMKYKQTTTKYILKSTYNKL